VKQLQHFYQYELRKNSPKEGFIIPYTNLSFVPEEIAALLLSYAKEIASKTSSGNVKDCVITVLFLSIIN
jgi:molecular chaperone DnaK (HSP70)